MSTVLAIGAHPDDIELGCGGTLRKMISTGDDVYALVLTSGEGGGTKSEARRREAVWAGTVMQYKKLFFGKINALEFVFVHQKYTELIEEYVKTLAPSWIFCHSIHDRHQNHEVAAKCSLIASRGVNTVMSYELPSTLHGFTPNAFVEIGAHLDDKLKALAEFKSQAVKRYMQPETVIGRARDWAARSNYGKAVEAFSVERMRL